MKLQVNEAATEGAEIGVRKMTVRSFLIQYNALVILVALIVVASIISPLFLTSGNIYNVLRQQATYLIIAVGMLMVMLTGGIDLSVSTSAAIGSIMVAYPLEKWGMDASGGGLALAILIGLASCFVFGAINGFFVAYMKMPAFIVTLATMFAGQGVAYMLTNAGTFLLDQQSAGVTALMGFAENSDPLLGVPYPVYLALFIVVLFGLIMSFTSFGRLVIATGSNETAVRLAGINTKKYIFWVYTLCGLLCGVAGLIITAKTGSATPLTTQVDYNMGTIAGVVIGGCSLTGGEGSVPFTVVGVFVIAVIGNIMNLISLAVYPQMIIKAVIIILAVLLKSMSTDKN